MASAVMSFGALGGGPFLPARCLGRTAARKARTRSPPSFRPVRRIAFEYAWRREWRYALACRVEGNSEVQTTERAIQNRPADRQGNDLSTDDTGLAVCQAVEVLNNGVRVGGPDRNATFRDITKAWNGRILGRG